jgi:ABC-2 type transport system permease protein
MALPGLQPGALGRMRAILLQELYITGRSLEVICDLYFFSAMGTIAFGLVSVFVTASSPGPGGRYLLLGLVLWEILRVTQYSMSVSTLWNVWSHNLSNMFVSPISFTEYVLAHILSATAKSVTVLAVVVSVVMGLFHLDLLRMGAPTLVLAFVDLSVFAWALGLFILGLILRYGARIQALAWGTVFVFQPLCAVFFPVRVLPAGFRQLAEALPATHVFEAARTALDTGSTAWSELAWATGLGVVYLAAGLWSFFALVRRSQRAGQFAKNDV